MRPVGEKSGEIYERSAVRRSENVKLAGVQIASDQAKARLLEISELARDHNAPAVRRDGDLPRRRKRIARGRLVQVQAGAIKQRMVEAVEIAPMAGDHQLLRSCVHNRCRMSASSRRHAG